MAIIRKNEYKNLQEKDIDFKIVELNKELMKLKSQVARGTPPENPGKIRTIKRTIARLYTHINNKKSGGKSKTNE